MNNFSVDLTNTTDDGFVKVAPGKYSAEVAKCVFYVSEKGNPTFRTSFKILESNFKGQRVSQFMTITDNEVTKAMFLATLRNLGVVQEGDREANNNLKVTMVSNETEDNGNPIVHGFNVNGAVRAINGAKAFIVVIDGKDPQYSNVDKVEPLTVSEGDVPTPPDGKADKLKSVF